MKQDKKFFLMVNFIKENILKIIIYALIIFLLAITIGNRFDISGLVHSIADFDCPKKIIITFFVVALIVILICKKFKQIVYHFKSKTLNNIDLFFITTDIVLVALFGVYQTIKLPCLIRIYVCFQMLRALIFAFSTEKRNYNNISLSDLFYNRIKKKKYKSIVIRGDESEEDLLNKSEEIENIKNTIMSCNPEKTFVIGINGEWGKGKTTLINFVMKRIKNESDDYVIINFDPCRYKDCDAMLYGFYNEIAKELGLYDSLRYRTILNKLIEEVFRETGKNFEVIKVATDIIEHSDINSLINNELEVCNKKMIVVIDNLDRADREIIYFFIRCMHSVTEFKNTVFLILHDTRLINRHLSKIYGVKKQFLNKIINLPISIAETDRTLINEIWYTSANNLRKNGYIKIDIINRVDFYEDLREVVRSLNYLIHKSTIINKLNLDYYDYLGIAFIRDYDYALYKKIRDNYDILTFNINDSIYSNSNNKEHEEQIKNRIKEFYNEIHDTRCAAIVERLFKNITLVIYLNIFPDRRGNGKKNEIDNIYYFYMYFSESESDYSVCEKKVNNIVNKLSFDTTIDLYKLELQKNIFEEKNLTKRSFCIDILKDRIENSGWQYNSKTMFEAILNIITYGVDNEYTVESFKPILLILLSKMNLNDFYFEVNNMKELCENLSIYDALKGYPLDQNRSNEMEEMVRDMCNEIKLNPDRINLLDKKKDLKNIPVLFKFLEKDEANELILSWVNNKNIFNYLKYGLHEIYDGKTYKYSYHPVYEKEKDKIDRIIKEIDKTDLSSDNKNIIYIYINAYNTEEIEIPNGGKISLY